jgi:MATE family multidrug resistance protein
MSRPEPPAPPPYPTASDAALQPAIERSAAGAPISAESACPVPVDLPPLPDALFRPSPLRADAHRKYRLTRDQRVVVTSLAYPIIGAMASQNIVNLVDTWMVGKLGTQALAAVGLSSFVNFMAVAFMMGLSSGVQAMCARWRGAGREGEIAVPLNGGLLIVAAICVPTTLLLVAATPSILAALAPEPAVAEIGTGYLQYRLLGITAVGLNFSFRGYWNAIGMSRLYMGTLVSMHLVGIALNWVLIFGNLGMPAMGAEGAGLSNAISVWVGTAVYFALAWHHGRGEGFLRSLPSRQTMRSMFAISLPAGLQQLLFASGMLTLFAILSSVGTAEVAAGNVLINLMLVAILPSIGFGLAAATLVGQSLGAGSTEEAYAWGWRVARFAAVFVAVLALPAILVPDLVLQPFLHDPEARAVAIWPLRVAAVFSPLECIAAVLMNSHLGAGSSRIVLGVSVATQWGLFLPLAWLLGPTLGFGLLAIWTAQAFYRVISLALFARSWRSRRWATVRL